jgi:glutamate synthase domain-containing protein 2
MGSKDNWIKEIGKIAALAITGYMGSTWFIRKGIEKVGTNFIHRIMVDPYHENLWEPISASRKVGVQNIVEANLRSQYGKVIKRPLGSPKKFPDFENVMFNVAQLHRLPVDEKQPIDTAVTIGPNAQKPLQIKMPIMISGMAYALALSAKTKIALAKGSSLAGTATNTGEGAFLPAERKAADKLIIQYSRGEWTKSEDVFRQADAVEIHLGQGAGAGVGSIIPSKELTWTSKRAMGVKWGKRAFIHSTIPGMWHKNQMPRLVSLLREVSGGVPVGIKIAASKYIEKDLEIALGAGVDYIVLDGAQAGTKGSPPMLQDDFGLPTLFALARATKYLEKHKYKDKISLILSGGFYNPGQMLKALALGADAVYVGAIALFAVSHTEVLKAIPLEPPTSVVFATGKSRRKFNLEKGAKNIGNFLIGCNEEIMEGIRALGKTSLKQVNKDDLFALDTFTSEVLDIPLGYKEIPFEE